MFENSPNSPSNGMLFVILPPELSYRTIRILVQYMYCGEATVSNDVLSEVLRGGELLKIRGLCRAPTENCQARSSPITTPANKDMYTSTKYPNSHDMDTQFRGLGASVVAKTNPNLHTSLSKTGTISINREVAIDPDSANKPIRVPLCTALDYSNCTEIDAQITGHRHHTNDELPSVLRDINRDSESETSRHKQPLLRHNIDRKENQEGEITFQGSFERLLHNSKPEPGDEKSVGTSSPDSLSFPTIKQEPVDWQTVSNNNSKDSETIDSTQHNLSRFSFKSPLPSIGSVKVEQDITPSEDEEGCSLHKTKDLEGFPRTVCEVCNKSFESSTSWVHHMESHRVEAAIGNTNNNSSLNDCISKSYVPKKRRRVSSQQVDHVMLQCDLCSIPFASPAEWVRHIHNKHTEMELAVFNNKKDFEQQNKQADISVHSQIPLEANNIRRRKREGIAPSRQQHRSNAQHWTE